jgi:hydrogenase maturation protein HypF
MKNTFCLTREKYAFLSHYIGEMDNWETYQDFRKAVRDYEKLFRIKPVAIAYDRHPDYTTTKYALERASVDEVPAYAVQHHHAHLAAVMIENNISPDQKTAGLIFDGTGFGTDGTIWGGEVLVGNCGTFERPYHLKPVPLPGGDVSILKPARMALSTLWAYNIPWDDSSAPIQALSGQEINVLKEQLEKSINTPMTSSMGRLFDAVAALIGVRETVTYEAQAAIELEALADGDELGYYAWEFDGHLIDVKRMLLAILADLSNGESIPVISARFHNTIAQLSLQLAKQIRQEFQLDRIALSGGVWQNKNLLEKSMGLLRKEGFHPLIHHLLPPNDGCVSFGQATIAAYRYLQEKE